MKGVKDVKPEHAIIRSSDIVNTNLWRNWPVICVDKVEEIPIDYPGLMGVPITFMDKYNPEDFEIIDISKHYKLQNGREPYKRIFIRAKKPVMPEKIDLVATFDAMGVPIDFVFVNQLPDDSMPVRQNEGDSALRDV